MKRTGIALLSAAALLAAGGVSAGEMDGGSDISWTYGQVGFVKPDGSGSGSGGISGNGYDVAASIGISKHWHAGARWSSVNILQDGGGFLGGDATSDTYEFTGGWNAGLTTHSQAYIDLGYLTNSIKSKKKNLVPSLDGAEGKIHGVKLTAGVRYKPVQAVEVGAAITYRQAHANQDFIPDSNVHDTSLNLSGQYFIFPAWSLGASVDLSGGGVGGTQGGDTFNVFTRYSFGYRISQ